MEWKKRWAVASLSMVVWGGGFAVMPEVRAATLVVTSTADVVAADGACTLREALIAASSDGSVDVCGAGEPSPAVDVVQVPAGIVTLAIAGAGEDGSASGDLDLSGGVEIVGAGRDTTILDGHGLDRVLHVLPGARARIADLTIRGGKSHGERGGGVLNQGTLVLESVAVTGNLSGLEPGVLGAGNGFGGGIANEGTLDVVGSVVSGNQAGAGMFSRAEGGGIWNTGSFTIENSEVSGNSARYGEPALGGGIRSLMPFSATATLIQGNTASASEWNPATNLGAGGGVQSDGAVDLIGCTVSANVASGGSGYQGVPAQGGGIHAGGGLSLRDTTVSDNRASSGSGQIGAAFAEGGGVRVTAGLVAVGSTISGNLAQGGTSGGAEGGGVAAQGTVSLTNSTVSGNTARGGGAYLFGSGYPGAGGGLHTSGSVQLANVTIASNQAIGGAGAWISSPLKGAPGGNAYGGGWDVDGGTAQVVHSLIAGNVVTGGPGGDGVQPGPAGVGFGAGCNAVSANASGGGNLESSGSTCPFVAPSDRRGVASNAVRLDVLAQNGGPTETHALLPGSVAIDLGGPAPCPITDQRGAARADGGCDSGAFEFDGPHCVDADGDGYAVGGAACGVIDCDDGNAAVNPGAMERPGNGVDDDCNPATPANPGCASVSEEGVPGGGAGGFESLLGLGVVWTTLSIGHRARRFRSRRE